MAAAVMATDLTRPIIGIENRTPQEVFDIMCDRIRGCAGAAMIPILPATDAELDSLRQELATSIKLTKRLLDAIGAALDAALAGEGFDGGDFAGLDPKAFEQARQWVSEIRAKRGRR
jgi:hypothetical protein